MSKKIEEVDILRGLAAALMILGHSFIEYPVDISNIPWCAALQHFIYTFHMELFFLLAGVVYHCSAYLTYIRKKTNRILIPYLFFGLTALILKAFGGKAINGVVPINTGLENLFLFGGGYWFLYSLFAIFLFYPFLNIILNHIWKKCLFVGLLIAVNMIIRVPALFTLSKIIYYLPFFIIGQCVIELTSKSKKNLLKSFRTASIALVIYVLLEIAELIYLVELNIFMKTIRAVSIIEVLYFLIIHFNKVYRRRLPMYICTQLKSIGSYSLQLYLFNGYLMTLLRILICSVLHINLPSIIVLGIWVGDIAITLITCKYIIPRIPIIRKLCGL